MGILQAVHAGHGIVALGDPGAAIEPLDLLVVGRVRGPRRIDFDAGNAFRALRDERAVALFGAAPVRDVHPDREPAAPRERCVGPDGIEHGSVPGARPEFGPLSDRGADRIADALPLRRVGIQLGENVALTRPGDVVAEWAGPLPIAPL